MLGNAWTCSSLTVMNIFYMLLTLAIFSRFQEVQLRLSLMASICLSGLTYVRVLLINKDLLLLIPLKMMKNLEISGLNLDKEMMISQLDLMTHSNLTGMDVNQLVIFQLHMTLVSLWI